MSMNKDDYKIECALNSVAEKVLKLYKEGELGRNSALQILIACRRAMKWDFSLDSNWDDAVECLNGHCGACLKEITPSKTFNLASSELTQAKSLDVVQYCNGKIASWNVCSDCFDKIMSEIHEDEKIGPKLRKRKQQEVI